MFVKAEFKPTLAFLLIGLAVFASGCATATVDTHVSKDADIKKMEIEVALFDEVYNQMSQNPVKSVSKQIEETVKEELTGYVEYSTMEKSKGMKKGNHSYTFTLKDVEPASGSSLEVYSEDDYVVYNDSLEGYALNSENRGVIGSYRVHMPGPVVNTTGEKVGGNTVKFTRKTLGEGENLYVKSEKSGGIISSIIGFITGLF